MEDSLPRGIQPIRVGSPAGLQDGRREVAAPARRGDWVDYVQGPFAAFATRGVALGGLDLGVASRVPAESGLSSSAALEVAVAFVLD